MKKIALVATTAALVMSLGAFAGCSSNASNEASNTETAANEQAVVEENADTAEADAIEAEDATTPAVGSAAQGTALPADHDGRLETMDATGCSVCHGATDAEGTPASADAVINPEDHYVDNSYATGEVNDTHQNCGACHSYSA